MSHIHEKIDFTVGAFIVHEDKVLLRMHDKYKMWLDVGGHIDLGEDPIEALYREVKEESGLEIELLTEAKLFSNDTKDLPMPQFINRHRTGDDHEHVDLIYVARAKTTDIKPDASEADTEFHWFTSDELDDATYNLAPHTKEHAKQAIKLVSLSS